MLVKNTEEIFCLDCVVIKDFREFFKRIQALIYLKKKERVFKFNRSRRPFQIPIKSLLTRRSLNTKISIASAEQNLFSSLHA